MEEKICQTGSTSAPRTQNRSCPSLKSWHQVLDNILGRQVIVYMTTNNIALLKELNHGSLIRSERIDNLVEFNGVTNREIELMVSKFYETDFSFDSKAKVGFTGADLLSIMRNTSLDTVHEAISEDI